MKPLYVKKNGIVYKISGNGMPALYPAENVEYDNTVTSELQAIDVQGAIDELSTRQGGVQSDWNENDSTELDYIKNKPVNLVQDASYVHTDNNYDATAKNKVDSLGTASTKDVPASGNASTTQVVMGNDTRLTDARPASDVSAWAKASTKPTYTASEVGAIATTLKGTANGVAELDAAGKVPSSQLPSFVDDVIEVADYDHLPITGESGKIYVTLDTNKTYRWTGSGYAEISESLALGETSSTAYRGDRGKTAYNHATETKLSTATASGLYKVASTAQGHIASLTAVQKSDITALGIPGSDTTIKNTAYGTCDTAGDVKDKVATLVNATNWSLEVGTIVGIRFTYTNTYTNQLNSRITLNINDTGAKTIRYSDDIWTSSFDKVNPTAYGESDQTIYYMYDGTYWVWVSHSKDNDTLYNFKGNEFRSADGNNAGQEIGFGGNANLMVINGHYYYNSNGPSTDIGAYGTDGAMFVQAYDSDNVAQIAQNYENGNLFVRGKTNGSWTDWKKPIANITGNNAVLTTDKTPFLTRQTLNPTGFSGYVREKLIGASYAWNAVLASQSYTNTNTDSKTNFVFTVRLISPNTWLHEETISTSKRVQFILNASINGTGLRLFHSGTSTDITVAQDTNVDWITGHKYLFSLTVKGYNPSIVGGLNLVDINVTDLTLAFGSTIADYLYSLANNGGITKLRDMGCPIDKYTPYGYGLYSVKTSGKKIVRKNLFNIADVVSNYQISVSGNTISKIATAYNFDIYSANTGQSQPSAKKLYLLKGTYVVTYTASISTNLFVDLIDDTALTPTGEIATSCTSGTSTQITVPRNGYISLKITTNLAVTISNLQIELGSSPTTYEPYSSTTYPLGNDELRGKFNLVNGEIVASGDVKESNGEITRNWVPEFNLGGLSWNANPQTHVFYAPISVGAKVNGACVCAKYPYVSGVTYSNMPDKSCYTSGNYFYIRDTAYNVTSYDDVSEFTAAMSGIYATCEKSTPTTEQSTPFADPMSLVGATTEEYIDTRDIPCPVGAERQYMGQSEDVVEIPSSPQSDGKRVLISEVSGGKEQVYWDIPKLYYKEYTVQGDGTKTYGDLLAELKPYYEALSEDEKTYSKVMMRATSSGNECLTFVGNYWYSRMGVNASGLWLDQIDFQYNKYFKQVSGGSITDYTNTNAAYNVIALRVLTYTRAES